MPNEKCFKSPFDPRFLVLWTTLWAISALLTIGVVCFKVKAERFPDIPKSQPVAQRPLAPGKTQKTPQQQIDELKSAVRELQAELADCRRQISDLRTELRLANKKIAALNERTKNISPNPRFQPILLPPIPRGDN